MQNLVNSSPAGGEGGSNHLISAKRLKEVGKKSFLKVNYISWSNSLVSTFTLPVCYEKQGNHCKSAFFPYGCTSQGVKHSLLFE